MISLDICFRSLQDSWCPSQSYHAYESLRLYPISPCLWMIRFYVSFSSVVHLLRFPFFYPSTRGLYLFLSQPHVVCTLFFPLGPVSFSIPIQMWSLPQVILFLSGHWVIIAHPIYSIWSLVLSRLISCHQRLQRAPILVRKFAVQIHFCSQ